MMMHCRKSKGASAPRAAQHISNIGVDKHISSMGEMQSMPNFENISAADINAVRNLRDKHVDELARHILTELQMQANLWES